MSALLELLGPILLLILAGNIAVRTGWFAREAMRPLGAFVIQLALPCVLFGALSQRSLTEIFNTGYLGAYAVGSLVTLGLGIWGARRLRQLPLTSSAIAGLGMSMPNSAFIAYPLVLQLFGPIAPVVLALSMLVENLLVLPLALALAEAGRGAGHPLGHVLRQTGARLVRNPVILAIAAGLLCSLLEWRPPMPLANAIDWLGRTAAPLALFVIGGSLVGQPLRGLGPDLGLIAAGKLLLHPLAVWLAFQCLPADHQTLMLPAMVVACAPMVTIYPLLGMQYGEENRCTAALVVTTLASVFSLSVLVALLAG